MTLFVTQDFVGLFDAVSLAITADSERLCALDGAIGDGDHGISMATGFAAASAALGQAGEVTPDQVFALAARSFLNAVGASCGPLYATAFLRASAEIRGLDTVPHDRIADLVAAMSRGIADRGKAALGDKTMLDVWEPSAQEMLAARGEGAALVDQLQRASRAAVEAENATAAMRAALGRAARLGDRSIGAIDPGASSARVIITTIAVTLGEERGR